MSVLSQGQPPPYQQESQGVTGEEGSDDVHVTVAEQTEEEQAMIDNYKQNIYKHPLFPLMALLFEKCEQATHSSNFPDSKLFDSDIQAFLELQKQENKNIFSGDLELDNLMVKSIQVLRIHLLEMEKVTDLCQDFCNRYIGCLKGKLQSESLLKVDLYDSDEDDPVSPGGMNQVQNSLSNQPMVAQVVNGNIVMQPAVQPSALSMATISQGQIVSGNTVYQMVQTPQGIVAQPIQIQATPMTPQLSSPVIQNTPAGLSQLGMMNSPVIAQQIQTSQSQSAPTTPQTPSIHNLSFFDDDDRGGKNKNKRGVLPKQATQVMKSWLFQHIVHPYPTEDEKKTIATQTNLTLLQVNNWFINARRRILQPMMDAGNPEQKAKKKQTPTQQPKQRFWPESIANIQPQLPGSETMIEDKPEGSPTVQTQPELQTESETTQIQTHSQIQMQSHPQVTSVPISMSGVPVSIVAYNGQMIGTTASVSGIVLDGSGSMVTVPKTETTDTVTESENS